MEMTTHEPDSIEKLSFERFRLEVLNDYRHICISRQVSLLGRKEVLTGKAKFGIFGDGKEVAQVAAAKFFKPGDFLSGYYRDQTMAFVAGIATVGSGLMLDDEVLQITAYRNRTDGMQPHVARAARIARPTRRW